MQPDAASTSEPISPSEARRKVLVADDERHIVRLIRTHLDAADYDVVTAYDDSEALAAARRERPDLLILDAMMPEGYLGALARRDREEPIGCDIVRALRDDPSTASIPIIMLST